MDLRKVIKQKLNEVAAISFEVREWAKILSSEIHKLISNADKAEADKQPNEVKSPVTTYDDNDSWDEVSHFENLGGEAFDEAIVIGDELMYDAETIKDFPEISNLIKGRTIRVSVESYGLRVSARGINQTYTEVLADMVYDHASWGEPFYDEYTHNELMAVFFDEVDNTQDVPKDNRWSFNDYKFGLYEPKPRANIEKLVINGQDFPETYEKFKVDKWIFNNETRIEYDHYKSGYNKENGEYEVYFNVPIRGLSIDMFVHEIKHAYDDWNRMRHGGKPIRDSWEIKNIYTKDFEKLILGGAMKFPRLGGVIRMYYLGSKLETPAYLENEFDDPMQKSYRNTAVKLMKFNSDIFFNKRGKPVRGLEEEFVNILINYDIPFFRKFKDVRSFLTYTEKYFNKRGKDIIKRIDKAMYVHGKQQNRPSGWEQPDYRPTTER